MSKTNALFFHRYHSSIAAGAIIGKGGETIADIQKTVRNMRRVLIEPFLLSGVLMSMMIIWCLVISTLSLIKSLPSVPLDNPHVIANINNKFNYLSWERG